MVRVCGRGKGAPVGSVSACGSVASGVPAAFPGIVGGIPLLGSGLGSVVTRGAGRGRSSEPGAGLALAVGRGVGVATAVARGVGVGAGVAVGVGRGVFTARGARGMIPESSTGPCTAGPVGVGVGVGSRKSCAL